MKLRLYPFRSAFVLFACTAGLAQPGASVQAPLVWPITAADQAFADSLAPMTLEQAQVVIAKSDPSRITPGVARALRGSSIDMLNAHRATESLLFAEKASAVADRLGVPRITAKVVGVKGQAYKLAGDNEAALAEYDRAITIYGTIKVSPEELGPLYGERGRVRSDMGDLEGSEEDGEIALDAYQQINDVQNVATILNNLAVTAMQRGDYIQARERDEQSLRIARERKDKAFEALVLGNIAAVNLAQKDFPVASDYALQAMRIDESLNSRNLIYTLLHLAEIDESSGRPTMAMERVRRAFSLLEKWQDPILRELVLDHWGTLERKQNHLPIALEKLSQSYALALKMSDNVAANETLEDIAEVELGMKRYADAIRDAEDSLAVSRRMRDDLNLMAAADVLGDAYMALGRKAEARAAYEESIAAIERLRQNAAGGEQSRSDFFAAHSHGFESLVSLDASEGRWEEAFLLSERQKGRSLLDLLTQGRSALASGITADEKAEERKLRIHLAAAESERTRAGQTATARLRLLDDQLSAARTATETFRERMYATHPALSRHRGDAHLITLAQTARFLRNDSSALLEYEVTGSATYVFVITRGKEGARLHGFTIPVSAGALRARIREFQNALSSRNPRFATSATALYRFLLSPMRADLAGKRSLIIIPGGDLWHLPFQALQRPDGRYLIEDTDVSYAPSLSVLNAYESNTISNEEGHVLLALGDPRSDLPDAKREVTSLAALYAKPYVRVFTGHSATKDTFMANAGQYDVIHLATHGVFDDQNPMYSHLILSGSGDRDDRSPQVAQLDAAEIAEMNIRARLVVLSACETARGKYQAGEGLIGLGWSFLAAGARSAVASQWRVDSASTTKLMVEFHRSLQHQVGAAAALREAELTVAHTPGYRHPYYWAGFVLLGID
jgi:CHAT domain-containing protein